ncbi:MAG: glutamate racemase [Bacteroidales bacterium]|nr:glutamate racemase [Bacteroidales bacterium]
MIRNNQPIGIFDSGVGGLTVWKELVKSLPNESVIYYADSANCPYGPKDKETIINLVTKVVDFLISKECKAIIVACNTATAAAIDFLRSKYDIPFIGMEPAVKPAAQNSKTKSIAVLATEGTFNGKLYTETSRKYAKDVVLNIKVGDKLVDIVEKGMVNAPSTESYLRTLINPLIDKNIDHLVLGCTHYPFLIGVLEKVLPINVKIIDPTLAIVKQTKRVLGQFDLLNLQKIEPFYNFYSSGEFTILENILRKITNKNYRVEQV